MTSRGVTPWYDQRCAGASASGSSPFSCRCGFTRCALLCILKLRGLRRGGTGALIVSPEWAGRCMALLFLLVLLGTNLAPEVSAVQRRAFGEAPFGAPVLVVVSLVQALLYLPY